MHQSSLREATNAQILIIEDSKETVNFLTKILSREGYQVESCCNGKSGLKRLMAGKNGRASMPDLLLLDLNVPGVDGLTILRRIRDDRRFARLPVIVITVEDEPIIRLKALRAGANDFILKPFETVELLARLKTVLRWKVAERFRQRRMEYLIEAGRAFLSTLDLDRVLQRVMEIALVGLNAEGASIWLESQDRKLVCRAVSGESSSQLLGMQLRPGQGVAGWSLQHKQTALVPDVKADPRFFPDVSEQIEFETRDLIAVPLVMRGKSIGVLEAVNKKKDTFSSADVAWMEVLAPLAAASIANARLFKTLRERTVELKRRNEELDAFGHTVAHDLQSPLTLIIGFAETLEKDYDTLPGHEVRRHLKTVARIGHKMGNIINELMLLAQLRKQEVQVRPLNMAAIVNDSLDRLSYAFNESQAEIVKPNASAWPVALGYGPWIEEVWVNYISNALKYGGRPGEGVPPRIELGFDEWANEQTEESVSAERDADSICFWLRDNGRGLTAKEQDQLFTPFTKLKQVRARGHGLGLSIVRRIVEKLNGQVGVESEVGEGSLFYFTLPRRTDQS